jgi:rubrerythrin
MRLSKTAYEKRFIERRLMMAERSTLPLFEPKYDQIQDATSKKVARKFIS